MGNSLFKNKSSCLFKSEKFTFDGRKYSAAMHDLRYRVINFCIGNLAQLELS